MRRIVLLLIVASVVMFAVVLKTPLRTIRSVVFPEDDPAPQTQTPQKQAPQKRGSSAKASKSARVTSTSSAHDQSKEAERASTSSEGAATAGEVKTPVIRISKNPMPSHVLTTSVDSVALYSNNSTRGAIVGVLRRGIVVVPTLQVTDGNDNWMLVKVPELNLSGFIQSENVVSNSGE